MKLSILPQLRCPTCRSSLRPSTFVGSQDEIEAGILACETCCVYYPVANYIPILLDFETNFHRSFAKRYESNLSTMGLDLPKGAPRPGEMSIQETFSDQWDTVQDNQLSFTFTTDELVALHRDVWMTWVGKNKPKTVLDVGCGLGREAEAIQLAIGEDTEVFGIDLNFACLQSGSKYRD